MLQRAKDNAQQIADLRAEGTFYHRGEPTRTMESNAEVEGVLSILAMFGNRENLFHFLYDTPFGEEDEEEEESNE